MKVSLPLLGFSWYGLKVVSLEVDGSMGLTGCGFLSSSCLSNSGCLGLSALNLTKDLLSIGGGGGGLLGLGGLCSRGPVGLVRRAGVGLVHGAACGGGLF